MTDLSKKYYADIANPLIVMLNLKSMEIEMLNVRI